MASAFSDLERSFARLLPMLTGWLLACFSLLVGGVVAPPAAAASAVSCVETDLPVSVPTPREIVHGQQEDVEEVGDDHHHGKKPGIGSAPQQPGQNRVKRAHRRLPVGVRV
jgi:hypothetical protein